jgi:fructose-1,6-bisphosphatase/inositol monophosphatase family enzyme
VSVSTKRDRHDSDLQLAHELAAIATDIALAIFGRSSRSSLKPDGSPVGAADLLVERALIDRLGEARPNDAILSEESGSIGSATRRWILDPIDGTVVFLAGQAQWGTQIALEEDGEVLLGMVTRPVAQQRWWATKGGGAYRAEVQGADLGEGCRLRTSGVTALADARVTGWPADPFPLELLRRAGLWVDVEFNDLLSVLEQRADIAIVPGEVWDHAPLLVLLEEAGGSLLDPEGGRLLHLGAALYTCGAIDAELVELLWQRPR